MATLASIVTNPILFRTPHPAKLSNSRRASSSVSFPSCPKFNVDVKLQSCFFSAADKNQYPKVLGRHASSMCNATRDNHLGCGKPLGRVGGEWSAPYRHKSDNNCTQETALIEFVDSWWIVCLCLACLVPLPHWRKGFSVPAFALSLVVMFWLQRLVKSSIVTIQLGFSAKARDLGFDLNQIAESADTSTYLGLCYVLNETTIALLRHLDYYNSCSISVLPDFIEQEAKTRIEQLSYEQRFKNKETLINVNNNKKLHRPTDQKSANDWYNDNIKVTLYVAARRRFEFPKTICNKNDLENVLQKLRSVGVSDCLKAVETLWTPQVFPCSAATST